MTLNWSAGRRIFLNQLENITEDMLAMQKQISFVKDGNILSKNWWIIFYICNSEYLRNIETCKGRFYTNIT